MRLRNAPVAADLVAEIQPLGDAVVGLRLRSRLKLGNLRQPLGSEQSAFNREGFKGELGLAGLRFSPGCHVQSAFGNRTKSPMKSAGSSAFTL